MSALLLRRLRMDLRGAPGHLVRLFAGVLMLFTIVTSIESSLLTGAPGLTAFRWVIFSDALLISAASTMVFASVVAAERENGTLALLRMTGMRSSSLLLGQGASGVIIGGLLLAVQFPFIVLTTTLGGVLWDQVLASFLALAAHLVLCAGVGLLWSSLCKRSGTAAFWTLLTLAGLWLGPWALRDITSSMASAGTISNQTEDAVAAATTWVDRQLAWQRLQDIASSLGAVELVSSQFWMSLAGGVLLFAAAILVLDRRPVEVTSSTTLLTSLARSRGRRAWTNGAITGKDFRLFMGGRRGAILRWILYPLVPLVCAWLYHMFADGQLREDDFAEAVAWTTFAFCLIELNAIAARLFRNEVAEQTWATLTLIPRDMPAIIAEKLAGAALGLLPGIVICLAASLLSEDVRQSWSHAARDEEELLCILMQPAMWLTMTSVSSMLFVSLPPVVIIFCGLIGFFVQYGGTVMLARVFMSQGRFDHHAFNQTYLTATSLLGLTLFLVAILRLRKLTARD